MRLFLVTLMTATLVVFAGCGGDTGSDTESDQTEDQSEMMEGESSTETEGDTGGMTEAGTEEEEEMNPMVERSKQEDPGPAGEMAILKTNHGDIKLRFYTSQAPKTVANFKGLAAKDYYDGVTFHRVIKNFMIQGGDPTATGRGGQSLWGGKFEDEISSNLQFSRPGILAMANAGPNTNGSQFFITQVATPHLNGKHTIFGEVAEGMEVVNAICDLQVSPSNNKPVNPVVIEDVEFVTE